MQVRFVEILADFNTCAFLASSSPEFEPLLSWSFWLIPQEWYTTDPSLVYPSTMTTECYDEQLSDKCLTLLLGTWYEPTPTKESGIRGSLLCWFLYMWIVGLCKLFTVCSLFLTLKMLIYTKKKVLYLIVSVSGEDTHLPESCVCVRTGR